MTIPLSRADLGTLSLLQRQLRKRLLGCSTLEVASQQFVDFLDENFADSVALTRLYALLPFRLLSDGEQMVARQVAADASSGALESTTPVLSLLGTRGTLPEWGDRRRSVGHRAIPLASASFTRSIPMVARMLSDLGADIDALSTPQLDTKLLIGGFNGLFYVADAASALDEQGRRIIPAIDFVREHGVRTVFGMGGRYFGDEAVVAIVFCRELVERYVAEHFALLIQQFKVSTTRIVGFGNIFSEG